MDSFIQRKLCRAAANTVLIFGFVGVLGGEEQPNGLAERRSMHLARMREIAESIQVYSTPEKNAKVDLVREPVLRYSDNTRQLHESSLWIWGNEGRPCAIVAIEFYTSGQRGPRWLYEIASLSNRRIAIERGNDLNWTAKRPGLDLQVISGVSPADSRARRQVQMKEILRRFAAHERATVEGRIELRPLSSPLYRYEDANEELMDGAIFSFANGTNPEILLVLEARRDTANSATWQFGLAQMTGAQVTVEFDSKEIWSRGEADPPAIRESYINGWIGDEKSPQ